MPGEPPQPQLAYIAQGRLYRRSAGSSSGEAKPVESAFGQSLRDRAAQIQNRHAWKQRGTGAQFMYGLNMTAQRDPGEFRVAITSVCSGPEPGAIFYTLETDEVGGIFAVDADGIENRLFHTADFRVRHIASSADRSEVAASIVHPNFCTNIAVMKAEGAGFQEVTEGESIDLAPSWVGGAGRRLVFQSAGIGRDGSGRYTRIGASSIQMLDLDSGELSTLAEEADADLLGPRMTADGTLFYIRRPFEAGAAKISPWGILKDTILFPFRMSYAVFQFFNFFSMRYTGKPLANSGGGMARQPDLKQMMIWGNLVDADKATRGADRSDAEAPSLVPSSWQLMRRTPSAAQPVSLAKGVLSFDIAPDGALVYSNGSAIYRLASGERRAERVLKTSLIEQVVSLA